MANQLSLCFLKMGLNLHLLVGFAVLYFFTVNCTFSQPTQISCHWIIGLGPKLMYSLLQKSVFFRNCRDLAFQFAKYTL